MTGVLGGMGKGYQTPAKKHKVPKSGGEKGNFNTQVGELDDEMKEPTPAMRITKAAHDQKVYATQDWIAGRINSKKHSEIHSRANHAIKNAHKITRVSGGGD